MRRREFMTAVVGAAAFIPHPAWAQRLQPPLIAVLEGASAATMARRFDAFRSRLRELGYVEGGNIRIEYRYADGFLDRLPALAAELVSLQPSIIVSGPLPANLAASKATTTIPIVMANGADPVSFGLVQSLSRPGGNITGLTNFTVDISPKLFEMLHSTVPKMARLAVLINPANPSHAAVLTSIASASQRAGVKVMPVEARSAAEIEQAFVNIAQAKAGAVLVPRDGFYIQQLDQIAKLATKHGLPSISGYRQYAEAGGLMSYGQSARESFRRAATYVDKIFKGAKPGDLPIEQPTTFELYINGRTAKSLGLTIPQSLLISADKVI